ncbi:MAG: hypothetical protein HGA90_03940 [Alphaproteobacteria bacterium]|nr:hypothetical protein [Alphaproteobacteria bacterium]
MANFFRLFRRRSTARSQRGIAATEFALTLPIWVTLLLGSTDGAMMMLISQRVDRIAYTVTDIVTQSQTVTLADLDVVMQAASQLMQPFDFAEKGVVIVTSLYKPMGQPTQIKWQYTGGGSLARSSRVGLLGQTPAVPGGLTLNDNENIVVAEVFYAFSPMFLSASLLNAEDLYHVSIYKPRLSPLITAPT